MRAATLALMLLAVGATPATAGTLLGAAADLPTGTHVPRATATAHIASLGYGGGPVLHLNRAHLIFWQPARSGLAFDTGYRALVEAFLSHVAADSRRPTNVYSLTGQYGDASGPAGYNSAYGGSVLDGDQLPRNGCQEPPPPPLGTGPGWTVCLSGTQLDNEVDHVVSSERLPRTNRDVYFLVLPRGFGNCEAAGPDNCALGGSGSGYCGYHTVSNAGITYAVIPYNAVYGHCQSENPRPNASTADPALSTLSHEHNEIVTDPFGNAWISPSGEENGDLCISSFGHPLGGSGGRIWNEAIHGGHYYLQMEYSNDDGGCAARDEADRISFSEPGGVRVGRPARFRARARDPDGAIVGYAWFFGDRRRGRHRVTTHRFSRGGVYRVLLRTTDSSGNWAFSLRQLRVRR